MSGITGVSSGYTGYGNIASGTAISSAADGAAELSIIQDETADINGLEQGSENISQAQNVLSISDAALSNINDSLQRIYELSIQAMNGTYSAEDKQSIQDEINQLIEGIDDIINSTDYNGNSLLSGESQEISVATDANGNTTTINTGGLSLDSLGLSNYDVTGDFDLSVIEDAIDYVNGLRSTNGAQSNKLSYEYDYNQLASQNLTASASRLEDLDIAQAVSDMKKEETLQAYQLQMEKRMLEDQENAANQLTATI